jgi:hypothetical protein
MLKKDIPCRGYGILQGSRLGDYRWYNRERYFKVVIKLRGRSFSIISIARHSPDVNFLMKATWPRFWR